MPEPVSEILFVVREGDDGGLIAEAVGHSIVTEADDLDALRTMVRDAVACHFEEGQRPRAIRLHYVHDECA